MPWTWQSQQNDSLSQELPDLIADCAPSLELGVAAFGNDPEAVNIWMGDERAVSALHKDHYENLYCVVHGEKHFLLFPPADVLWLEEVSCRPATYCFSEEQQTWSIVEDPADETGPSPDVPWVDYDEANPRGLQTRASPVRCVVKAGETLYLPSLWYHQVSQKGLTIAVNYWHDMAFDHRYVYYKLCRGIMMARRDEREATGTGEEFWSENEDLAPIAAPL